ncbi:MAG: ribosome assembly RNA-binding protein YhbY [Candidatus Bathyarchaeia archaeon]
MNLKNSERQQLKAIAHSLDPLVRVGRKGVNDALIKRISRALENHELIKVKFLEYKPQKRRLSEEIAERTSSQLVEIIGNVAIFYRENPNARTINLS